MANFFNNIERVLQARRPVPVALPATVAKPGAGKGTKREAAAAPSAAAPAGGSGGGASTVPVKPTLIDSCISLLRALIPNIPKEKEDNPALTKELFALAGVFAADKSAEDLSKRALDYRLHEDGERLQALKEIAAKRGRASVMMDLVGTREALKLIIREAGASVTEPGRSERDLLVQTRRALDAIKGRELEVVPDEAASLDALRSMWTEIAGNATMRAYEFLKRGRMETQLGLTLLAYQLVLLERSIPKAGEGPRDPEKTKVTVPPELAAALDRAIEDMAGADGGTNGGDAQKKTKGGAEITRLFALPLKSFHLQTSGKGIDNVSPFTFETLLHVLTDGYFDSRIREAARTVLASFFAYRERETQQYIEAALASDKIEVVEEGLKMLRIFYFVTEDQEAKTALFNRAAGIYLGSFVEEAAAGMENFDCLLRARKAARTVLLEMTAQELSQPHERETAPMLAERLMEIGGRASTLTPLEGCRLDGGIAQFNVAETVTDVVAAQRAQEGDLYVEEPGPSGKAEERIMEPKPAVWRETLLPAIQRAQMDVLVELVNEKNLGAEERVEAQRALEKIARSPYLSRMLERGRAKSGKEVTLIGVGVVDRTDIREGEILDAGELENGKRVFLSKNKGNAHAILNGEKVLVVTFKMGKKKLRIGIRLNQGNGTRNNVASMAAGSKGAMLHGKDTLANGSSKSTAPNIAMLRNGGEGGIVEHPADNLVACFEEMRAAGTSIPLRLAMEKMNIHMALFGERAASAGIPNATRGYQAHLGQLIPDRDGTITKSGFTEKPACEVLDYRKRRAVLEGFEIENAALKRLLEETEGKTREIKKEGDRRKVEGASDLAKLSIGAFFKMVFQESAEIGITPLLPADKTKIASVAAEFAATAAPDPEELELGWKQLFVEAANSAPETEDNPDPPVGAFAQKLAQKGITSKRLINYIINIAVSLRYTYLNTFNIYFSEEGLGLLRFYYGQAGSNGMLLTQLVGELDFSKRIPEAMMEGQVERWVDNYPGKDKTGGGTEEDWAKQWYIAQCLYLISGMPVEITDRIFKSYQIEYPQVEDLYRELSETKARLEAEGAKTEEGYRLCGGKIMIGAVDFFADVGTHLAYARSLQQALNANQTMRSLHRHWQGLLIEHNVEKGTRFGDLELAEPAFRIADEIYVEGQARETRITLADARGNRIYYPATIEIKAYKHGTKDGKPTRESVVERIQIRADGSCNIGGVEIADIAHTYIGGKSKFKAGTRIGGHNIIIAAEVVPPEQSSVSFPDYVMIEGAKVSRKMRFFGEYNKDKMTVLYDLWLEDDGTTFGVLPDTVVARQHLCRLGPRGRAVECHAVVPLSQDTKDKGKGRDIVLRRYYLTEENLTAAQPLFGFPLTVKEFWEGLNPVRVDTRETMLKNAVPEAIAC